MVCFFLQTIKCLLIVPNAESALNEEAGKLLLEHYDDYSQRARMMTKIHAQAPMKACKNPLTDNNVENTMDKNADDGPLSKKHATDKRSQDQMDRFRKEKKRMLKRL